MQWYEVLFFGMMLGLFVTLGALLLARSKRNQKSTVAIKQFMYQPPILEHCSQCFNGHVYATIPEHPAKDFEEKIKTPRVICRLGQDPWREEPNLCPDFVRDNTRLAKDVLTNSYQIF